MLRLTAEELERILEAMLASRMTNRNQFLRKAVAAYCEAVLRGWAKK